MQSTAPQGLALATPVGWALAKGLPEKLAQMCLIGKPDAQSDFAQRSWAGQHKVTGFLEPPPHDVGVRRFSERLFERAREVRRAPPRNLAEITRMDRSMQVPVDEGTDPGDLPTRQSTRSGIVDA